MAPSPPIDIQPASRHASSSPQNRFSNLTSALQQAGAGDNHNMYTDGMRQDSFGAGGSLGVPRTAARPISAGGARRGSNTTGSFMGGMSFGGVSMNSWVQDDIMMTGTSPFNMNTLQSPSFHSSSYLPKKEADFWSNLRCCDTEFKDLHELLQHYDDIHRGDGSSYPTGRMATPGGRAGFFRRKSSGFNHSKAFTAAAHGAAQPQMPQQPTQDGFRGGFSDMDTIGEMEMDFDDTNPYGNQQATAGMDGSRMRPGPINPRLANTQHMQNMHSSNPATPSTARATNNPMVSQGNTPSFTTGTTANTSGISTPMPVSTGGMGNDAAMLSALDTDFSNMDFSNLNAFNGTANNDFLELTINDPARALFSQDGGINSAQAHLFGFVNGANTNPDNHGGAMQPAQMRPNQNAVNAEPPPVDPYGGEDRPFKCLVVGCEKAYKNANGLRYHERHGHASQQLTKNPDGTLSIVNPETGEAFPGTVGMEKEKPYRCEACGKRYKNLNGLKYHKNHSPPCNPDLDVSKVSLPDMGGRRDLENAGMDSGVGLGGGGLGGMNGLGGSREGLVGAGGGWQL